MNDRNQLVELIRQIDFEYCEECDACKEIGCDPPMLHEFFADCLMDRVIPLPCAVGDSVYEIKYCRCGNPECFEAKQCFKKKTKRTPKVYGRLMLRQDGKKMVPNAWRTEVSWEWKPIGTICYKIVRSKFDLSKIDEVGKTVFLTEEEAEKALKERGDIV